MRQRAGAVDPVSGAAEWGLLEAAATGGSGRDDDDEMEVPPPGAAVFDVSFTPPARKVRGAARGVRGSLASHKRAKKRNGR